MKVGKVFREKDHPIGTAISALRTIEKDDAELPKKIAISNTPAGPTGRFTPVSTSILGS